MTTMWLKFGTGGFGVGEGTRVWVGEGTGVKVAEGSGVAVGV